MSLSESSYKTMTSTLGDILKFFVMRAFFIFSNYDPLKTVWVVGANLTESVKIMSGRVLRIGILHVILNISYVMYFSIHLLIRDATQLII
jgi:hypothetical protein